MVKLEIVVELKLLENANLCSFYVIQHFCDIVFVPSSYGYEGLCNTIKTPVFLSHTKEVIYTKYIYIKHTTKSHLLF